jgi:predicted lactoylglutathione lyase
MSAIAIEGASFVMVVKNLEQTVEFYSKLGFIYEVNGSKVKHHHISRDSLTLILVEALQEEEVSPISSRYEEQYFDVFAYTNAVDELAKEVMEQNIPIVREPHYTKDWSEFTFRDINGYQIAIGGGVVNKGLLSE